jgi:hypothetical protein
MSDDAIVNLFCISEVNLGDWSATPLRYFPLHRCRAADIRSVSEESVPKNVIVGGGGLLAPVFKAGFEALMTNRSRIDKLVGWGLGSNVHYDKDEGFQGTVEDLLPSYLDRFDLLGIRDHGTRYRWVPCVSCMHPEFSKTREITRPVVVYQHHYNPIGLEGLPGMTNAEMDMGKVLGFLGSAEVVVTNTYHGVYWATLLGRRVVALPFSSRFHGFRHPPAMATAGDWKKAAERTETYPAALGECRRANIAFYCDLAREFDFDL